MTKGELSKALNAIEKRRDEADVAARAYIDECEILAEDISMFVDEKSERWQEGVTGSAWVELRDELSMIDFDMSEVPELNL